MAIKIKEIYGYNLLYDERLKRFIIEDIDGTELAFAATQDAVEVKAKALSKQEFQRIRIVNVGPEGEIKMGELTSLNRDDKSAWVSMENSEAIWGSGRQKINLGYHTGSYEATEANLKVLESIKAKGEILNQIKEDIEALRDTLEKPIGLKYFGMTRY